MRDAASYGIQVLREEQQPFYDEKDPGDDAEFYEKEKDPNGLNSKEPGSKLDANKPAILQGVLQYFPRALRAVAEVSAVGAKKYSWKGWESVPDGINRYGDALGRHLLAGAIEGPYDADTGLLHDSQIAWNALARLELILKEKENALHTNK